MVACCSVSFDSIDRSLDAQTYFLQMHWDSKKYEIKGSSNTWGIVYGHVLFVEAVAIVD